MTQVTVSIIGTAGRKLDGFKMNTKVYNSMINKAKDIIENTFKLDPAKITLVSGGAAWSDHVAVDLFQSDYVKNAKLYLPTEWDAQNKKYHEADDMYDSGKTSNYYHKLFSTKVQRNTLQDIDSAIKKGLVVNTNHKGFKTRNTQVAKSDYLIAFTWGSGSEPNDGGTLDTWNKSNSKFKYHVNLSKI